MKASFRFISITLETGSKVLTFFEALISAYKVSFTIATSQPKKLAISKLF